MKQRLKLIKRLILFGIVSCMLSVWGCNYNNQINSESEKIFENEDSANTEQFDRYDLELEYNAYEKDYSAELEIGNKKMPIEIWCSNVGYRVIKIGEQEIPYAHRELPLGGTGLETMASDVTGDGNEEIVFLESSGEVEYILIFGSEDGQWEELEMPSEVYDDTEDSLFLEKQLEELHLELEDSVYVKGRNIDLSEENILIQYFLWSDTNSGAVDMGLIQKELLYASDEKRFILGDALYLPAENNQ